MMEFFLIMLGIVIACFLFLVIVSFWDQKCPKCGGRLVKYRLSRGTRARCVKCYLVFWLHHYEGEL